MIVVVDTNVMLDVFLCRQLHYTASAAVVSGVASGTLVGVCPAHALTTLYYLVRNSAHGLTLKRQWITCCSISPSQHSTRPAGGVLERSQCLISKMPPSRSPRRTLVPPSLLPAMSLTSLIRRCAPSTLPASLAGSCPRPDLR